MAGVECGGKGKPRFSVYHLPFPICRDGFNFQAERLSLSARKAAKPRACRAINISLPWSETEFPNFATPLFEKNLTCKKVGTIPPLRVH